MMAILIFLLFMVIPCVVGSLIVEHTYNQPSGNSSQQGKEKYTSIIVFGILGFFLLIGLCSYIDSLPKPQSLSLNDVHRINQSFYQSDYPIYEFGFSLAAIPTILIWRRQRRRKLSKEQAYHGRA